MKKMNYFYIVLACICFGCSDFLEESSQDLMVPKSVKDYKEFLYGEGINNKEIVNDYLDVMTDDVDEWMIWGFISNDWRELMWGYYTWQAYPEIGINNEMKADNAWESYYHRILVSNVILDQIGKMEGTSGEKDDLTGECYFVRAYSYFMLANLYGKPYLNKESAQKDFCVPINDEVGVSDHMYTRSSVAAVYARMESDIKNAIHYLKAGEIQKTIFRPNLPAAYLLASRIALFQKDYEGTIAFADSVLRHTNATLYDLNTYSGNEYFFSSLNPELLYTFGWSDNQAFQEDTYYLAMLVPAKALLSMYKEGDLRLDKFYSGSKKNKPLKWSSYADVYAKAFRVSEVYLNRAEANAELGRTKEALDDLNVLRKYRFSKNSPVTGSDVITKVREERRVEFAFEGFRWFDLRRWDRPRIEHRYTSNEDPNAFDIFVLEENSLSYTLPIPKKERDLNTVIERIGRPESVKKQ